ncbi:MAG: hypothetical protein R3C53_11570 [Pirellulaceae bacterium]
MPRNKQSLVACVENEEAQASHTGNAAYTTVRHDNRQNRNNDATAKDAKNVIAMIAAKVLM